MGECSVLAVYRVSECPVIRGVYTVNVREPERQFAQRVETQRNPTPIGRHGRIFRGCNTRVDRE